MSTFSRRTLIKTGLAASAAALADSRNGPAAEQQSSLPLASNVAEWGQGSLAKSPRKRYLLDFDWRFHLGHASDPVLDFGFGASRREGTFAKADFVAPVGDWDFDDASWRLLDLPHDWAVELPFLTDHNTYMEGDEAKLINFGEGRKPIGREFPDTSIGWYRRKVNLPNGSEGKRVFLEFDGVFRDAVVLFNNHYLGRNFSGYAPFHFDVTNYVRHDRPNQIALRADATLSEGWFYEGTGIYRHVWLTITDKLHIPQWGTYIQSFPRGEGADVIVRCEVANHSDQPRAFAVSTDIVDSSGDSLLTLQSEKQTLEPWSTIVVKKQGTLRKADFWTCEQSNLYSAVTSVRADSAVTDHVTTIFGIRSIRFDADKGFYLNDKLVKIKGTCNHQDHAGVGSALPDQLQADRVALLKASGSNACRTSHNPPTPEFMDACDRAGMLVMAETRMMASTPEGLSQLERMVRQNRNHPSVIIWSLANEEPDQGSQIGANIVAAMKRAAALLDPTRPVTVAMNGGWGRGVSQVVDVQGFNYAGSGGEGGAQTGQHIDAFHRSFPAQPAVGTETASVWTTRGIYKKDSQRAHATGYDINFPGYTLSAEGWWTIYSERAYLSGGFAWTGFEYRGEPSPFDDTGISSPMGMLDLCGFPKDSYFYYSAWWGNEPILHLFPHWDWPGQEDKMIDIWCYSNLSEIELLVNGKSAGRRSMPRNGHLQWSIPYHPGAIEARGFRKGRIVLTSIRETTGPATAIKLTPNRTSIRANREDLVSVQVEVIDAQKRSLPTASNMVSFKLAGVGRIIGVGNGDPGCREADKPESAQTASRSLFSGLTMVYVQALDQRGEIKLEAEIEGLPPTSCIITSQATQPRPRLA